MIYGEILPRVSLIAHRLPPYLLSGNLDQCHSGSEESISSLADRTAYEDAMTLLKPGVKSPIGGDVAPGKTFCGIDPSILSTGLTIISGDINSAETQVITPRPEISLDICRMDIIARSISNIIPDNSLVAIEEPMGRLGHARKTLGVFWIIRYALLPKKCIVFSVAPRTLKMFATNDGASSKKDMTDDCPMVSFSMSGGRTINRESSLWKKHSSDAVDSWWLAHAARSSIFRSEYHQTRVGIAGKAMIM